MLLWLGLGAAFIQPLYFWLHTRTNAVLRDPSVPHNEAIALFFAALPSFLLPLLIFLPSWLNMDTFQHHGYIAAFLGSPFAIVVSCLTVVGLLIPWHGLESKKDPKRPHIDHPWIVSTFTLVGILSAVVHIGCIGVSLWSSDPDFSLARVYFPSPGKMHSFVTDPVITFGANGTASWSPLPAAYHTLYEGYHLFTQLDYAVVACACLVFTHWTLHNRGGDVVKPDHTLSSTEFRDLVLLVLGGLTIGPGAAGSFALAAREKKLRLAAIEDSSSTGGESRKIK